MPAKQIDPLCDKHNRVMTLVINEGHASSGDRIKGVFYACAIDGCTRQYDEHDGYFDFIVGRPLMEKTGKTPCPDDGMALYLASSTGQPPKRTGKWVCPECGKELQMQD